MCPGASTDKTQTRVGGRELTQAGIDCELGGRKKGKTAHITAGVPIAKPLLWTLTVPALQVFTNAMFVECPEREQMWKKCSRKVLHIEALSALSFR